MVGRGDLWAPNSHPVPLPQTAQDQVPSGLGRGGLGQIPENHGQTIPADYNVFPAVGGPGLSTFTLTLVLHHGPRAFDPWDQPFLESRISLPLPTCSLSEPLGFHTSPQSLLLTVFPPLVLPTVQILQGLRLSLTRGPAGPSIIRGNPSIPKIKGRHRLWNLTGLGVNTGSAISLLNGLGQVTSHLGSSFLICKMGRIIASSL